MTRPPHILTFFLSWFATAHGPDIPLSFFLASLESRKFFFRGSSLTRLAGWLGGGWCVVWANHADALSVAYSGTPALKTDYTRTGKRTLRGNLADGWHSLKRYALANFADGRRQVRAFPSHCICLWSGSSVAGCVCMRVCCVLETSSLITEECVLVCVGTCRMGLICLRATMWSPRTPPRRSPSSIPRAWYAAIALNRFGCLRSSLEWVMLNYVCIALTPSRDDCCVWVLFCCCVCSSCGCCW